MLSVQGIDLGFPWQVILWYNDPENRGLSGLPGKKATAVAPVRLRTGTTGPGAVE